MNKQNNNEDISLHIAASKFLISYVKYIDGSLK